MRRCTPLKNMKRHSLAYLARGGCLAALALVAQAHPPANTALVPQLTISLTPKDNGALLARTVHELSDPKHARYARHLSHEAALDLLQPSREALTAVKTWLRNAAGLQDGDIRQRGQFLYATVSAKQSASLLKRRKDTSSHGDLHGAYSVAEEAVRKHIRAIHLGSAESDEVQKRWHTHRIDPSLPMPPRTAHSEYPVSAGLDGCDAKITPACLREKYQMRDIPAATTKKTILGVMGFGGQTAQHADLDLFLRDFDPSMVGANFSETFLNGGENPQGSYPASEGNLDIQYAVALAAANVDVRFYSVGGRNFDFIPDLDLPKSSNGFTEPYLAFATTLAALPDDELPSVLSISYGVNEQLLARDYAEHVCDIFGQLSARGVSVLAASGDAGPGQSCRSNADNSTATRFLPAFPASCPYVTAVGATRGIAGETAMELSGGGFSEYFPRPAYQLGAVDAYLAKHGGEWKGLYNPKGRGIPDVAALGRNYQLYYHGTVDSADGTSASTPVLAAMIAVLNGLRAEKGKPPLGFLNTWLYTIGRFGFTEYVVTFL
ncbi:tripeptidyl-peptidase 1 precursor [Akanthomyces lecanii RCEF 1005]|uniref:tripeptidyl-peptidase II n=1 Tax=Akanthomyces lecanii RCEF 1005 TaxID=1081108 RepID=A0A168BEX8_CORDF|nr:tripeptidyl-peptidase 1 precursor [Akanthomyces lecanii RCEF 1005]